MAMSVASKPLMARMPDPDAMDIDMDMDIDIGPMHEEEYLEVRVANLVLYALPIPSLTIRT